MRPMPPIELLSPLNGLNTANILQSITTLMDRDGITRRSGRACKGHGYKDPEKLIDPVLCHLFHIFISVDHYFLLGC